MEAIFMKKNRWTLLAVLLGMMVAMAGCFGGGRIPTGGVIGYVYAPRTDITDSTKGQLVVKALEIQPGDESKYERLPGATVKSTGTTRTATTDTYGRFVLNGIPIGEQTITITHPWYKEAYSRRMIIEDGIAKPLQDDVALSGKGYYLLIGVGEHGETDFWTEYGYEEPIRLTSAPRDVAAMRNAFLADNSLKIGNLKELVNSQARISSVYTQLGQLINQMEENDYLVIYFSGHGVGGDWEDTYHRFDAIVLYDDFLGDLELREYIDLQFANRGIPVSDVTLILDACNSGSFADGKTREITLLPKAFMKTGYTVISSSRPEEESYVFDEADQGLFTYYAEIGLGQNKADLNRDGVITASELCNFVAPLVDKHARESNKIQNVDLWPGNGDPVIFKYVY